VRAIGVASGVFISYRRIDAWLGARAIFDRVKETLGAESVFFDRDSIAKGVDFVDRLKGALDSCYALIAVIGMDWADEIKRRLADPNDYVRLEVETVLARNIRVIPVLIDRATMPKPEELPDSLKALTRRNAIMLSEANFDAAVQELIAELTRALTELRKQEAAGEQLAAAEKRRVEEERLKRAAEKLLGPLTVAFDNQQFDDLVRLTIGEDVVNEYVPNGNKYDIDKQKLIDELRQRGVLPQFLHAVRAARPASQKTCELHLAIDAICENIAVSEQVTEKIECVKSALANLLEIIRRRVDQSTQAAKEELKTTVAKTLMKSELAHLARDLTKMQAYKSLHDVLQRIQLDCYPFIMIQIKTLGGDDAQDEVLESYIDSLKRTCLIAQEALAVLVDIKTTYGPVRSWIETLNSAVRELEGAVKNPETTAAVWAAKKAMQKIREVLGQQPANMNNEMRAAAESLRLGNLVETISNLSSAIGLSESEPVIGLTKVRLESLRCDLGGQISTHNRWQKVENQLWSADMRIEASPSNVSEEFRLYWENATSDIVPLWDLDPEADWVKSTRGFAGELNALLAADPVDNKAVAKKYRSFRKAAVDKFFKVDVSLKIPWRVDSG
jgi:hypothetical protein